jgi:tetratricopeptide (TPR) repeat protein
MARKPPTAAPKAIRDMPAWLAFVMLVVAISVVYIPSLEAPLIFDDIIGIELNESIVRLWPLFGTVDSPGPLRPPIENPMSARPLVNLTLALNYHFGALNPRGYHLVNLALHFASAMLLWTVVRRTLQLPYFSGRFDGVAGKLALAVALIWALHPLATEAVVYVTQRTELLVACCYLATIYASLRYWAAATLKSRRGWLAAATITCLAGAASKEVMVSAPIVVFLFEGTFVRDSWRSVLRSSWPLYLGLGVSWILIAFLQIGSPRSESAGFGLGISIVNWWSTQAEVFFMYLKLAAYPFPLIIHYELKVQPLAENWPYVMAAAAIIVATLWLLWHRRTLGFVLAAVLLILAPTHLVPIPTEMAAERRMYLPLATLVAFVVVSVYALIKTTSNRQSLLRLTTAAAAAIILFYAIASYNRLALYVRPVMLFQDAISHQPDNPVAQLNLAVALAEERRIEEAVVHYRIAAKLTPNDDKAHYGLGLVLAHLGQLDESIEHLREVVRLNPKAYRFRNNLGVVLFTAGRYPEAIVEFEKTLQIEPTFTEAQENLNRARQASVLPPKAQ